ncbi:MAG: gas vesicle protein GvpG [Methanothrix sp.]|nr:gas vesicle protein GvpG [Methanothrix sp.]MCX8206348.1 gas vesicle protein GvpG [Methanothrix sp.]
MFVIDDLLLRSVGISVPGLDLIWTLEQIRGYAQRELYNPERIRNQIKETRLLYEFGEISREEYMERTENLVERLRIAEKVQM